MSENNNHPATAGDFKTHLIALHEDAVLWKAKELYKQDAPPHQQQQAVDAIVLMLCAIQKEVTRSGYIDLIYKELKIKRGILSNAVSNKLSETADKNLSATMLDDEGKFKKLPEWVDVQKVYNLQLDWQMNQGIIPVIIL
jgi:hypothetical protein